jgi:hypothetical protein
MLRESSQADLLLAAWTGNYTTDIFNIDDVEAAREARRRLAAPARSASASVCPS